MEEATAPSAGAETFGDGVVLYTSDVTEDAIKKLERQGYSLSVETDDGRSVFRFNGERHTANEDLAALNPVVEDDDTGSDLVPSTGEPVVLRGERAKPLEWRRRFIKSEDYLRDEDDKRFYVPDTEQEVDVEINIHIAADRRNTEHTEFVMKVHQATVTVHNSKNEATHRGYFLTQLQVTASPVPRLKEIVESVTPDISDAPDDTFSMQKSFTTTLTGNIALQGPSGGLGCSSSESSTSNRRFHSWGVEKNGQQLTWTWQLEHWGDGQPFHVDAPGRVDAKRHSNLSLVLPELPNPPFRTPKQAILKPSCEAEWVVRNDKLKGVKEFEWDVEVKFVCASVQVTKLLGKSVRKPVYVFELGKFNSLRKGISLSMADSWLTAFLVR